MKGEFITYNSEDEWACHVRQGHMGSTKFGQEAERNKRKVQANTFIGFSAEKAKQGKINS